MPLMTAGSVKLLDPLKSIYADYGKTAQNSLSDALGTLGNQAKTSSIASGRVQGDYTGQALGRASSLASQGINNTLASTLGGASLKDMQAEQEYQRQKALAEEIGSISKPSTLQEVISGLGGAAQVAGQGASLYKSLGNRGGYDYGSNPSYGLASNPYSPYDPTKMAGYSPYDYLSNWGGR